MIVGVLLWPGLCGVSASASEAFDAGPAVSIVTHGSQPAVHLSVAAPPPLTPPVAPPIEPFVEPTSPLDPEEPAPRQDRLSVWLARLIPMSLATVVVVALWKRDVIRPGSFSRTTARRVPGPPWFVWVLAAVVVFMAAQVGSGLALALAGGREQLGGVTSGGAGPGGADDSQGGVEALPLRGMAILSLGSYAAAILAAIAMARLLAPLAEGLTVRARHFLTGIGCFVLAYPVVHAVSTISVLVADLFREGRTPRVAHDSLRRIIDHRDDGWAWVLAGAAVLGAPIVEEMIYRVFLQTGLLRAWKRPWVAILATAVLFAAAHITIVEVYALPTLLVLGAAMGLAYERTKSPVVPITMHVLFNGLNVVMAMLLDGPGAH